METVIFNYFSFRGIFQLNIIFFNASFSSKQNTLIVKSERLFTGVCFKITFSVYLIFKFLSKSLSFFSDWYRYLNP